MPAAAALTATLTAQFDAVEANVPGTIRDVDTEFLHDLRIAIRRTRSALKLAGDALPGDLAARFRPEFKWIGDLTTPARDLDVYLLGFDDMVASLVGGTEEDLAPFRQYLMRARTVADRTSPRAAVGQVRPARPGVARGARRRPGKRASGRRRPRWPPSGSRWRSGAHCAPVSASPPRRPR